VLVTLLALELGTRVVRGQLLDRSLLSSRFEAGDANQQPYAEYHPRLGWVPNLGVRNEKGVTSTVLEGNFRSNGTAPSPAGKPILAVGDSFTFGSEVNDAESWPAQLEALLGKPVINAGVGNYGLDQAVLRAEEFVPRYDPELLIVSFIEDDIERCELSVRFQAKPYFTFADGRLQLQNVPVPAPDAYDAREMDLFRRTFGYSHLADFVMRRVAPEYWLNARFVFTDGLGREKSGADEGKRIACALMSRLRHLREDHGTEILVVAQYTRFVKEKHAHRMRKVLDCAQTQGHAVLDLFDPLDRVLRQDPSRFGQFFRIHMTAGGNAFVADEIARFLESPPATEPASAQGQQSAADTL
jgi:hypothetical protein